MPDSLSTILEEIASSTSPAQRRVEGLWGVDCLFNPAGNGRIFNYKFLLAQTTALGCAYSTRLTYPAEELESYINKDFLQIDLPDMALKVALMDSAYPACNPGKPDLIETMDGFAAKKMRWRSELILREAERVLGTVKGKRIVNVGVVGDILTTFKEHGADIIGTDFDPVIAGTKMFDQVQILDGKQTPCAISTADLCVVTGMTITTCTIDSLIKLCREKNVKMIVFAETGINLGSFFVKQGVDVYLGETFPFYIFHGTSRINIYRSRQ
jgi:hypothetical protein